MRNEAVMSRTSVGHPAGCCELAHACVDDGVAGAAVLPRLHLGPVGTPHDRVVLRLFRVVDEVRVFCEEVGVPVPPCELADERLDVPVSSRRRRGQPGEARWCRTAGRQRGATSRPAPGRSRSAS